MTPRPLPSAVSLALLAAAALFTACQSAPPPAPKGQALAAPAPASAPHTAAGHECGAAAPAPAHECGAATAAAGQKCACAGAAAAGHECGAATAAAGHECGGATAAAGQKCTCAGAAAAGHECGGAASAPAPATPRLSLAGGDRLAAGQKLAGLPAVTVAQLTAKPTDYAGKSIRLEGKVSTLCFHRHGWYAVRDPAAPEGPAVRVITAPAFLVPENAIGRTARAEGKVEVVEVPAATALYFAKSHGIGNPEAYKAGGPVKQVIVRAVGAEFM